MRELHAGVVEVPEDMPPGAIILATGDTPRFHGFTVSLLHTLTRGIPLGTTLKWNQGLNLCLSLNDAVGRALNEGAEWCWILGDDHTWPPDLLVKLWQRRLPILAPLVLRRAPPYRTVIIRQNEPLTLEAGTQGVITCDAVGTAGMLVQRVVFEALGEYPFEIGDAYAQHEDVTFCYRAQRAGFAINVDLDLAMGHITTCEVWPARSSEGEHAAALVNPLTMHLL